MKVLPTSLTYTNTIIKMIHLYGVKGKRRLVMPGNTLLCFLYALKCGT